MALLTVAPSPIAPTKTITAAEPRFGDQQRHGVEDRRISIHVVVFQQTWCLFGQAKRQPSMRVRWLTIERCATMRKRGVDMLLSPF